MSNIIILFGEMGSGKNYWGEKISQKKGYLFVDGDDYILPEMLESVTQFKFIKKTILNSYIEHLGREINELANTNSGIVLAQALYLNEHRVSLAEYLRSQGHNVMFKWVRTSFFRNMKQIFSRTLGTAWVFYWLMNKPFFQKPTHDYEVI